MRPVTIKKLKRLGLDPKEFTTETPETLVGKVVVADPKTFGFDKNLALFEVTGGFGAEKGLRGSAVFVKRMVDGQEGRIEKYDVIAVKVQ